MRDKISPQASLVLGVLAQRHCHLTADEILASMDGIGTATVYRALDHLTALGLVRRLSLGKKSAVYEYVRKEHAHFVCSRCGGVFDIPADFSGMVGEAALCSGHKVLYSEVTAHGVCQACLEREHQENAS